MQEFIEKAKKSLEYIYSLNEINAITNILLEHIGISKISRFANPMTRLDSEQTAWLDASLDKLIKHTPIQHIIGYVDFYGTKISVNKHTLIPRPETEELVDIIVKKFKHSDTLNILDLCTGSGCIAIALAKSLAKSTVDAVDISDQAIIMAKKNAAQNKVDLAFKTIDLLKASTVDFAEKKYDIIVSNPPYIPNKNRDFIDKNVMLHEPEVALFVPDTTPIIFYEKISLLADELLKDNGFLFFETHEDYTEQVANYVDKHTRLSSKILKDLFGKNRFTISSTCQP